MWGSPELHPPNNKTLSGKNNNKILIIGFIIGIITLSIVGNVEQNKGNDINILAVRASCLGERENITFKTDKPLDDAQVILMNIKKIISDGRHTVEEIELQKNMLKENGIGSYTYENHVFGELGKYQIAIMIPHKDGMLSKRNPYAISDTLEIKNCEY